MGAPAQLMRCEALGPLSNPPHLGKEGAET